MNSIKKLTPWYYTNLVLPSTFQIDDIYLSVKSIIRKKIVIPIMKISSVQIEKKRYNSNIIFRTYGDESIVTKVFSFKKAMEIKRKLEEKLA